LSNGLDLSFLKPGFLSLCPGADIRMPDDLGALEKIEVAVCWNPPRGLLARMPGLRLVQSIGAGVDHVLADPELPRHVPVCRVIDPGMASGMAAYVLWAVIHQQRHFDRYLAHAAHRRWQEEPIVPPRRHVVGIAGYGWLGSACAKALTAVGFSVRGWHRGAVRPAPPGVALYRGEDQLDAFLEGCNALVCLLPLTPQTSGFLSRRVFEKLPKGAHVINVGRGAHLVETDLLAALAAGQVGAATLDAFSDEPLPREHAFWNHPRIIVTPHIASRTDLAVIAAQTLENLAQVRQGLRPEATVDLRHGY
jgi:glyoxylate/hydroxypyruvate reductase A